MPSAKYPDYEKDTEIRDGFSVSGFFYRLNGQQYRSLLEIHSHAYRASPDWKKNKPDAVAILMNPGSSEPDGWSVPSFRSFEAADRHLLNARLKKVVPDPTQHQLQRLMKHANWNHVRVVNLSDACNPEGNSFCGSYQTTYPEAQSIFDPVRKHLPAKIIPSGTPVIAGWGLDQRLAELVRKACAYLGERGIDPIGIPGKSARRKTNVEMKYYRHPNPRRYDWRVEWWRGMKGICGMLNEKETMLIPRKQ